MQFVDRNNEITMLEEALKRENRQFVVIWGRRRIGKSTLIRKVLDFERGDIYFLADTTSETSQRKTFSEIASATVKGFNGATYSSWEALFVSLSQQLNKRITVCLDEFPYLVKSCPSLPSVLQKLIDEKVLTFDLIICGSSQQLMKGYVLDSREPLYGRAQENFMIQPIPAGYIREALNCNAIETVEEYSVWGGIPRYWELRSEYPDMWTAIKKLMLQPQGILVEEPQRLLRDDMRDTVQTSTLLSIIGNGANRLSEIASRAGKDSNHITEPLNKLRELGYIQREFPFGENEKKSKKGLYKIKDPFLSFHFRFIAPYRSYIEMGRSEVVLKYIEDNFSAHVGKVWEELCREYVSGNTIDGISYKIANRWQGTVLSGENNKEARRVELDVVAESFDGQHILIGECKWTKKEDGSRVFHRLQSVAPLLPFIGKKTVHFCLFLKEKPLHEVPGIRICYPEEVLGFE
jgi:AAA+ ATPase superfamily predicted ATPase